ncbi:MAG: hypothetical protein HFG41_07070 [Coprococcus sp.]|nr:hypothetical protein [Coprococcus sp.]
MKRKIIRRAAMVFLLATVLIGCAVSGGCRGEEPGHDRESDEKESVEPPSEGEDEPESAEKEKEKKGPELREEEQRKQRIAGIISGMTLEEKVCQLFMVTPEQLTHVNTVIQAGEATKASLEKYPVGGIVYFKQNILDEEQIKTMITNSRSYSKYPLFIGVDEEGGSLVARIANNEGFSVEKVPDMQTIGASQDIEEAYQAGQTIGTYLSDLGFDMDFAPVADVLTNPNNTAIGKRSFGPDAKVDAQMVAQVVKGLEERNVKAVLKHFPGHGGTDGDSHEEAVANERTLEQLEETEFLPFISGIQAGAKFVMVGHISLPSVTGDNTPATLSPAIIGGLLRERLGFDGVVITDSMSMGAITNYYTPAEAAVKVIQAGGDMVLMPANFEQAYEGVLEALRNGTLKEERIDESVYRILDCKIE